MPASPSMLPCLLLALIASLSTAPCSAMLLKSPTKPKDEYGLKCRKIEASNMHKYVTAIVTTSARPGDASGKSYKALKSVVNSIRTTLGLDKANMVVAFDALNTTKLPNGSRVVPHRVEVNYGKKIKNFTKYTARLNGATVTIFRNKEWTHQTEMLHRVFDVLAKQNKLTPIVFVAQDDTPVIGKSINVPFILKKLSCDPQVEFVRFMGASDCRTNKTEQSCVRHNDTKWLHSAGRLSGRPHFATTKFYYEQIFNRVSRSYRGVPKKNATQLLTTAWMYGKRRKVHEKGASDSPASKL